MSDQEIILFDLTRLLPERLTGETPVLPGVAKDKAERCPTGVDLGDRAQAAQVWDEIHAVATLQGIVNRDAPRLYLRYIEHAGCNIDDWWLAQLSQPGQWLAGRPRREIATLEELVAHFASHITGAVLYDPQVPATSNVASTLAGVEDLIAVRYDPTPGSLYDRLVVNGPQLPVRRRLLTPEGTLLFTGRGTLPDGGDSTGSAKCDAYRWALRELLHAGRCNPAYLAYYIDAYWIDHATASVPDHHTLTNHDFFVAQRAFFCDLHCWGDEAPVDDPHQPLGTDLETLKAILLALYQQNRGAMVHVGGFTPWAFKYTDFGDAGGTRGGVATEWEMVRVVSAYNAYLDADAIGLGAMANASFFMHYPLAQRYPQAPPPTEQDLRAAGYLDDAGRVVTADRDYAVFYVGDYDAAAWLHRAVPTLWEDPARGTVPLSWAISPVLERRAPAAMAHMWQTRSAQDAFMAGDNGAGYLNPSMLVAPRAISDLPSGLDRWVAHCRPYYQRWDLRATGFVIDGHAPPMGPAALDAYAVFSPAGVVEQFLAEESRMHGRMPVMRAGPDIGAPDPREAADDVLGHLAARRSRGLAFHWFRTILKSPSWHAALVEKVTQADRQVTFVTADVFFELLRRNGGAME